MNARGGQRLLITRRKIQRYLVSARRDLLAAPRYCKLGIMLAFDLVAVMASLLLAFEMRYGDNFELSTMSEWLWVFLLVPVLTIPIFAGFGLYRQVIRYIGDRAAIQILLGTSTLAVLIPIIATFFEYDLYRAAVMVTFFVIATGLIGGSRFGMRAVLRSSSSRRHADRVVVWGAGRTGLQLAGALHVDRRWTPIAFVDDDHKLWGRVVHRLPCVSPANLARFAEKKGVGTVILAMPSATRQQRRKTITRVESLGMAIKTVPGMRELLSGCGAESDISDVPISDLLGRDPIAADGTLIRRNIKGKTVLVTGAGGSIGSELCRQILSLAPERLILLERCEFALYQVEHELRKRLILDPNTRTQAQLIPLLGSAGSTNLLSRLFSRWQVNTVYHAAAYKHVPIVELNVAEGVSNNALATWRTATAAEQGGVETFVLVSTDKAVRPTNVMGASKRMAEMVLQALMQRQRTGTRTRFSMVRFGNVLGSSGSVVPLFREQIRHGGPVTVTHKDINRFFMTVEEAVQLVIQAGSIADGGEVHVLDMGEPVRIFDLARRMIQLSGHKVLDEDHPDGAIRIEFLGLRPGEKLYEELLIGDDVVGTVHPRIMRGNEAIAPWEKVETWLYALEEACASGDCPAIRSILNDAVEGYQPASEIHDLVWRAGSENNKPSPLLGRSNTPTQRN
jgi:FlaA1/EpsC-like NDP-sugar epimerase